MPDFSKVTLSKLSIPAKALASCVIFTLAMGMLGAMAQIIVHDVVPTLFAGNETHHVESIAKTDTGIEHMSGNSTRGDLFSDVPAEEVKEKESGYDQEQLVWTLKWTHIHLFGINMIFILMAGITLLLNVGDKIKTWLIVLPFAGILIDIAAMWLKVFVSPVFFWLHIPGGSTFFGIFAFVSIRALWEMWLSPRTI